jgi:peptide/nickel transport system substrate-binding protein
MGDDWKVNPTTYNYQVYWRPPEFVTGNLAESYEFTTPSTFVVHLQHGIYWQNLPPANGREFIASDVVASYQRLFGLGAGTGSPFYTWYIQWQQLQSLTAPDNYTIVFQWKITNAEFIHELLWSADASNQITCPDAAKAYSNDLNDWHHAVGTGPFMVTDFTSGTSATLVKNPNYWALDERHPQNKLPYAAGVTVLIMPDDATAMAAMRAGKIDILYGMTNTQAADMKSSNPEITQISVQGNGTACLEPRCDKTPFSDVKVRQALQMAINIPDIAANYYGGNCSPYPSSTTSMYLTGWGLPYTDWPQDLKDQYAYNVSGAKALLAAAGYPTIHTDVVAATNWDMGLLQIVKDDFSAIGVTMDIRTMDSGAWTSFVRANHSQDALVYGASVIGNSFEPIFQMGQLTTNNGMNFDMISDTTIDGLYAKSMAATSTADFKQALQDLNLYVAQQHYAISLTTPNSTAFCQPWLKGYNGQAFAADFSMGAPLFGGFYLSRFWVDSTVKTK